MSEIADTELSDLSVPDDTAEFISQGRSEDGTHRATQTARSCCCPSRPAIRVLVRVPEDATTRVDLLLCAHHYRASRDTLARLQVSASYLGDGLS